MHGPFPWHVFLLVVFVVGLAGFIYFFNSNDEEEE